MAKKYIAPTKKHSLLFVWPIVLFFFMYISSFQAASTTVACLSGILSVFLLLSKEARTRLRDLVCPLFIAACFYILWAGISTFYAVAPKFALFEFNKLFIAFCVFLFVFVKADRSKKGFAQMAALFSGAGAIFGILSVEYASTNRLFYLISGFLSPITGASPSAAQGYQSGIRISTILENANIYAGVLSVSLLLSAYLLLQSETRRDRCVHAFLLGINALCYLLAFSMGSLFMCFLAALIYIFLSPKGKKADVFLLFLVVAASGLLSAFVAMQGLGQDGARGLLAVFSAFLSGLIIWLYDRFAREALVGGIAKNTRLGLILLSVFVVAMLGYTFLAVTLTAPMTLENGESVMRAVYPKPGEYRLSLETTGPVGVSVVAQNRYDLMTHTYPDAGGGSSDGEITFTVPEGTEIVKITFTGRAENGAQIRDAAFSGSAGSGSVALRYPLLPAFVANRIQDLFANQNAVQRGIFFEDGLKIFGMSPVLGRGLGGYENGVLSVQNFFYETKYAHNHYIQALCDLGIIGFLAFMGLLVTAVIALFKSRSTAGTAPFLPVLAACLFQMFGQGATDVIWSTAAFLPFAFAVFSLIAVFFPQPKTAIALRPALAGVRVGSAVFCGLFSMLMAGNLYAHSLVSSGNITLKTLETCASVDLFERNDYLLSIVASSLLAGDPSSLAAAQPTAARLEKVESNTIYKLLTEYYFAMDNSEKAFAVARSGIAYTKSNPKSWQEIFDIFQKAIDPSISFDLITRFNNYSAYVPRMLTFYTLLQETNRAHLDTLTLTPKNAAFVSKLLALNALPAEPEDTLERALSIMDGHLFDSNAFCDADDNGIPDVATVSAGDVQWPADGFLHAFAGSSVDLAIFYQQAGTYLLTIECDRPEAIALTINRTPVSAEARPDALHIAFSLPENDFNQALPFSLEFKENVHVASLSISKQS